MESGNLYFYRQATLKDIVISNMEPLQIFEQGVMLSEGSLIARGMCTWTEVLGWKGETGRRLWQKFSQEVTRVWSKRVAMAMRRKGL